MVNKGVLLLVVLTASALAVPDDDSIEWSYDALMNDDEYQNDASPTVTQCATTCPVSLSSAKFGYEAGKTYEYRYESDMKTSIPGTTSEHSSLHMRASVQIEVISTCEMVLRLSEVSLQDSNPTNFENRQHVDKAGEFRRALQERPMSFAFIDGRIDSVCPSTEEAIWVTNIKRGILSALQNTMTTLQGGADTREMDVSGDCPVRYEQRDGWSVRKVKKTKNLLACQDRQSSQTIFQAIEYDAPSDIQSIPLLKSTHECEQEIHNTDRIIRKSSCNEKHVYRPFSQENSGATTEVTYKLEYQRTTDGIQNQQAISQTRRNLLYDHTLNDEEMLDTVRDARLSLTTLCAQTEVDVRPEAPAIFNNLVKQMRKLDAANLKRLQTLTRTGMCQKADKYFRDALPVLGTTGSVIVMRDLISQGQATAIEADKWLTSIAFIKNPTPDMMKEVQPLLTSDFERSALPVSSLINTYCQLYDEQESSEVKQMMKTMEDELRYNCKYESDAQRSRMLKALKAIGNAGNAERIVPTINRCIANNEIAIAVRVTAITAFRRIACSAYDRSELFTLLENKQADAELRITAYLSIMQCADATAISRLRTILESDEVNQVGSFIWTHLTNLQETSCPMKSDIQDLLRDVELIKAYDLDKRKFSRNIELSAFSEVFNMGALFESNVIWSSKSFIPRSGMVNLTVDMFGQSINLIEFGGRAEGLESLFEKFFGPGNDNSVERQKRAIIRDDIFNTIDRKFPKSRDDFTLSYYMRIFGNEIRSNEILDLDLDGLKNRYNFLDWMIKMAKENQVDVTRNFLFLDTTFVVPTGVGMPLRLGVEGTATVALTANGKFDIRQMFSLPSVFDMTGSIRPSAALQLKGEMGVDAHVSMTGLKLTSVMHTSTIFDGKMQLQDGKIFNFDVNVPQDKVEILSMESHLFVVYRGQDREQQSLASNAVQKSDCTNAKLTQVIGVELCGEYSFPGMKNDIPWIQRIAPTSAKVYLNKRDTFTGFHFEAGYRQEDEKDSIRVSFNTPGSQIDRELTVDFKVDQINRQIQMNLKSPWKKLNIEGSVVNTAVLKKLLMKTIVDDNQEYSLNAEVAIDDKRQEIRYTPNVKLVIAGERQPKEVIFDGSVVYTKGKKATVNLALKNAFQQPITLDGFVELQDKKDALKYNTNLQFASPIVKGGLVGFVSKSQETGTTWSTRADVTYQIVGERTKERIVINHKFRDLSTNNLRSYSTDASWTNTMKPNFNGQFGLELAFSPNSLRTKIEAGFDDIKKFTISQSGAFDFSGADKKINGLVKLEMPFMNWDYELKMDHIHNWQSSLHSNATVKYGENKQMSVDVGLKKENTRFLNIEGQASFKMPGSELSISKTLTERAPREYYSEVSAQGQGRYFQYANLRATSVYKMIPRHEVSSDIQVAGFEAISIKGHFNPNLKNMQARAELTCGSKNFMTDVNWLHKGTPASFNTRASAEVAYLGRAHGLTTEISRRNQEFITNLDIKLAENIKLTLSSSVMAVLTEPKVQARFEWPENFVAVSASGKYETKGWYTTTSDLEGSIQFTSSLRTFEALSASFVHDQSAKSMKTTGEASWATDKKINADFSYDKNKIVLDMKTPFSGYQTIKAEAAYTPKGKLFGHTTKVSWENNQMVLLITGEMNLPSMINGKVTFTSPFKGFEAMSTSLKHTIAGEKYQSSADLSWTRGQQISASMTMNHSLKGWSMTNNGEFIVQTPFAGYRTSKLTWNHQNDQTIFKCHHELEMDRQQKYVIDVDASHKLTRVNKKITGSVTIQTPFAGYEDLRMSTDYQHDLSGIKSQGKTSVSSGSKAITVEHDLTFVPYDTLVVKGILTTPFNGLENIGLTMNNRKNGNTLTAANELSLGRLGTSTLGGTLMINGYNVDTNLRLTTPSSGYLNRVSMSLRNAKENDVWTTHADVQYAPDKTYSVDTKFGYESEKKIEVEVNSPHSNMRLMKFNARVTGNLRNFEISSELQHNAFQQDKFIVSIACDTSDARNRNVNAVITIRTPIESFSNFKLTARHAQESAQRCLTTATYELNRYRGSFNHEHNARNWVDFNTKTVVEYINGQKIEMTMQLSVDPKVTASATFKSPFEKTREISLTLNHDGPLDNFRTTTEININRRDKISSNVEFILRQGTMRMAARFISPIKGLRRLLFDANHSGSWKNFRSDASFEFNERKHSINAQFQLDGTDLKLTGQLDSPLQASISVTHNGPWNSFKNSAELTYAGETISANSEYNQDVQGQTQSAKFNLRTPFDEIGLQNLAVEFAQELTNARNSKGWSNNFFIMYNTQRVSGETEMMWIGKQLKSKAIIRIPEEYSIVIQHRGDSFKDFVNSANIKLNDKTVSATSSFKVTNVGIDGKANLETSYRGYEKFEATFKHEGPVNDFVTKASITTPIRNFESFSTQLTYRGNPSDFTSNLNINIPFRSLPSITVALNHKFDGQSLNSDLTVNYGQKPLSASATYRRDASGVQSSARLETPFEGYDSFYGDFNYAGSIKKFTTSGKFESTPVPSLSFSLEHTSPDASQISTTGELVIPAGKFGATFTHNGEARNFRSGLRLTSPYRKFNRFDINLEHDGGLDSPKSKLTVQTPVRGFNNFQLSFEKTGTPDNLQIKAEVTTPIKNWERTAVSWSHNWEDMNNVQYTALVETSLPGWEKFSYGSVYEGAAPSFKVVRTVETSVLGYERQSLTISNTMKRGGFKTIVTVDTSVPGYSRFSGTVDYIGTKKMIKSSVTLESSVRGYERFTGSLDTTINDANSFRSTVQVTTTIPNYDRFSANINHNGDLSQFETSVGITTPCKKMPQIDISVKHRGTLSDFTTGGTVEYNGKRIESEVSFKRTASYSDSNYEASVRMTTPCPYFRDFSLSASHNRQTELKSGAFDVTLNGEKKVDLDYRYSTLGERVEGDRQISINIRSPFTVSTDLNMAGSDGTATINWDPTRPGSQIQFDFGFKNIQTADLTDRMMKFKTMVPRRTIGFEFGYTLTADKLTNRGELHWDNDPEGEFVYEVEGTRTANRYTTSYDGTLKVTSAVLTTASSFSHKINKGRKYTTEVVLQTTERLRISNDVTMTSNGFTHTFLIQHPRFIQDASVITEGTITGINKGFKTTVKYDRQTFSVEGQLTDESQSESIKSSGSLRLTHPTSYTDIQLNADIFNDYAKAGGNLECKYQMSRDRSVQRRSIQVDVNKQRQEMTLELVTPIDTIRVTTNNRYVSGSGDIFGYEVAAQSSRFNVRSIFDLSLRDRSLDLKLYFTPEDYLQLFGQALTPLATSFEMSRYIRSERINDISASLSLSDDRMLTGSAFIRPALWRETKELFRSENIYPRELVEKMEEGKRMMNDDVDMKLRRLQQALLPFVNAYNAVVNDINAKIDEVNGAFNDFYDRNEFYIRDTHLAMKRASDQMSRAMAYKMAEWRSCLNNVNARIERWMEQMLKRSTESWQTFNVRLDEMRPSFGAIQPHWNRALQVIQTKFNEFGRCIKRNVIDKLELSVEWKTNVDTFFRNVIDRLTSQPELNHLRDLIVRTAEQNMWMYEYLGCKEQMTVWIEQARTMTLETLKAQIINYLKEKLQLSKNGWTKWDVRSGEYVFQVYIPFDLPDLSFLQRLNVQKYIDYVQMIIERLIPDDDWTLIDTVYSYWPSRDITNWVPPFKSHASITGNQYFMTYDHEFYEFAGECSYLLTRDFVDKSFSVIVNYDKLQRSGRPSRKSLTIVSDEKQIEIFPDAKMTIDGVRSEMPIRVSNTTILRSGSAIRVDNDKGFSVFCDLPHEHCSISVSGWYYNKMAGLLGTYDNEPSNDMTTIDNTITDKPELLADSWTIGQRCRPINRAIQQTIRSNKICEKYFKEQSSPFRSCFRVVNTAPFLRMCNNDMSSTDEDIKNEDEICKAAAAYVHDCHRHEVQLRLPKTCVRCEVSDSSRVFYESSMMKFSRDEPAPKVADVVFIVQHSMCNKDVLDKVKGLVDDLDKAMISEGLLNTRYAIVGFAGKDHLRSPHVHTMDGQIFNAANKIPQGLNKFDLESGDVRDPMAAVRYAAKLPFRTGASKTFILLSCDTCTENSIRYRDLQRALLDGDVRLHVLVQDLIKLKSGSVKTAFIFGADQDTVYTRKDVAGDELSGEPDLKKYIRIPKDLCVALTQDTDGSIFSAKQWLDSRPIIQKRFTDVMVRTFARKAQPSECQECECVADENGVGVSQCKTCRARNPIYNSYPEFDDEEIIAVEPIVDRPLLPNPSKPNPNITNAVTKSPRVTNTRRPKATPRPRPPRPLPKKVTRPAAAAAAPAAAAGAKKPPARPRPVQPTPQPQAEVVQQ